MPQPRGFQTHSSSNEKLTSILISASLLDSTLWVVSRIRYKAAFEVFYEAATFCSVGGRFSYLVRALSVIMSAPQQYL